MLPNVGVIASLISAQRSSDRTVSRWYPYVLFNLRNTVIFATTDNRLSRGPVNCSFAYPVSATVVSSDDRAFSRYEFTIKRRSCRARRGFLPAFARAGATESPFNT